ncbi:hypothetical protein M514_10295 [Trichuris suis]|uniref:Uncharacterized protein n=1 Tax=Trichuris suis TaxID=68888 RepID=A0A085LV15_9BILA|nr:hypothetical protein M513_10295 [Trichuris suis]KFD69380.1 hypothetical protein M514_10295 [Trichuris suis]
MQFRFMMKTELIRPRKLDVSNYETDALHDLFVTELKRLLTVREHEHQSCGLNTVHEDVEYSNFINDIADTFEACDLHMAQQRTLDCNRPK